MELIIALMSIGDFYPVSGRSPYGPQLKLMTNGSWCAKPTDFMTAANSGRQFKPESWLFGGDEEFRNLYYNLQMFSGRELVQTKILNGKWLVE